MAKRRRERTTDEQGGATGAAPSAAPGASPAEGGAGAGGAPVAAPATHADDARLDPCFAAFFAARSELEKPSVVQAHCWPLVEEGRDVLGLAPTGSGKTLAYLLPAVAHAKRQRLAGVRTGPRAPYVLAVVPTRELALQVLGVARRLARVTGVRAGVAVGGRDRAEQVRQIEAEGGVEILIVTPGRALDLHGTQELDLASVSMLILDEADKMLELGFEPQIKDLVVLLRDLASGDGTLRTQNVLLSATFPRKLRIIADRLCLLKRRPATVRVAPGGKEATSEEGVPMVAENDLDSDRALGSDSFASAISSNITQIVQVCAEHKKPRKLIRFIEKVQADDKAQNRRNTSAILVFCTKIKTVKFVQTFLKERQNIKQCAALHGDLDQRLRERTLREFKAGKLKILVATDVAGRGIDIKGLPYVVNYDFPTNLKVYAHRIGRTGRQDRPGTAFSFFTRNMAAMAPDLVQLLRTCKQPVDSYLLQLVDKEGNAVSLPPTKKRRKDKKDDGRPGNKGTAAAKPAGAASDADEEA